MAKKVPTIGDRGDSTSYPKDDAGETGTGNMSLGVSSHNYNKVNFVTDPDVFNASPATKKSYSWNKGETGNAT